MDSYFLTRMRSHFPLRKSPPCLHSTCASGQISSLAPIAPWASRRASAVILISSLRAATLRAALAVSIAAGAVAAPTPEQTEFFERKIRPVLAAECYECHAGKKAKGGLKLDWRGAVEKGGDTGPAIVPGNAAKSLLIQTIRHEDADLKMPKNGAKLDDDVIADFVAWVNMGAPDPRDQPPSEQLAGASTWDTTLALRKAWWSFQPRRQPPIPNPADATWSDHPVDRFLLAKMESRGLQPAPDADPRAIIRRLSFAVTGLPPKPDEIETFVHEWQSAEAAAPGTNGGRERASQSAIRNSTDRLLSSPQFGECWARHWMDLTRYAETHGSEGDPEIREAWRYRDYLIRAFNSDVPWDRLIREHLAGDLLPDPRWNAAEGINESILGIASLRLNEHGFQPVDTLDEQVKTVDNQIDVISKAFQGLTVSCARCHDHKFDAIGQRDFYALYGILASSRPAQVMIDSPAKLEETRSKLTALKSQIRAALADAWMIAAQNAPAHLRGETPDDRESEKLQAHIAEAERQLNEIEASARARVLQARTGPPSPQGPAQATAVPSPVARWSFKEDARDSIGALHGELLGGAVVKNGSLVLNGADACFQTPPLPITLREKTLEAWAAPENLEQRGGGVLTVETLNGAVFDSIVFAEKDARQWMVGSNNFHRTQGLNGPAETDTEGKFVHLAAVFRADNSIALFRNGAPYGAPYTPSGNDAALRNFAAGGSRILMGRRHTGGGRAFFAGQIKEARLYDRALAGEEIAASFSAGPEGVSADELERAMEPARRSQRIALQRGLQDLRAKLAALPAHGDPWKKILEQAQKEAANPLRAWVHLRGMAGAEFTERWTAMAKEWREEQESIHAENRQQCPTHWNLASDDAAQWFREGALKPEDRAQPGDFSIEPSGSRILTGLYPAGVYSNLLSQKFGGLLTSPRFKIETDNISVKAMGGKGAAVRLIVDNYPLGVNPIFPKASLDQDRPGWVRLDTAYRKGSWAYLEFGTYDDLTRPILAKGQPGPEDGRSFFGVSQVTFQDRPQPPREEDVAAALLFEEPMPGGADELAAKYGSLLTEAIGAWRKNSLSEPQRAFLDFFIGNDLLPSDLAALPALGPLLSEYRRIETEMPALRHAPGVMEARGHDAPLLPRGDYKKPGELIPRGYLQALDFGSFRTPLSGRLELANAIADPRNPLTARVMVNRIWYHLFGRGLVPTVDNFGRLGERPTNPDLLDFLADRFVKDGWSCKQMIRFLVTSRAYRMSSQGSPKSAEVDPGNELLSHFRVRRLEAESIRDSLLSVSGQLSPQMYGPPEPIGDRSRRSIYLAVRRNSLSPFLAIFDAPKPFSTLGRRDATNVPAQSLALLNDPFVISLAAKWAGEVLAGSPDASPESRVAAMFESAFGRPPRPDEQESVRKYLEARANDGAPKERVWQDLAQSLFNLKEFLYLR
jgi:Protein of unknown function (DUF1553)/Protein of unknown function (DUF1549)/Planctomycete cytochrome C/Concanavalin A-like lectin/glucanases superfamily